MNALILFLNSALAEGEQRSDFWLPNQASTLSAEIDSTFYFIYYTSASSNGIFVMLSILD